MRWWMQFELFYLDQNENIVKHHYWEIHGQITRSLSWYVQIMSTTVITQSPWEQQVSCHVPIKSSLLTSMRAYRVCTVSSGKSFVNFTLHSFFPLSAHVNIESIWIFHEISSSFSYLMKIKIYFTKHRHVILREIKKENDDRTVFFYGSQVSRACVDVYKIKGNSFWLLEWIAIDFFTCFSSSFVLRSPFFSAHITSSTSALACTHVRRSLRKYPHRWTCAPFMSRISTIREEWVNVYV